MEFLNKMYCQIHAIYILLSLKGLKNVTIYPFSDDYLKQQGHKIVLTLYSFHPNLARASIQLLRILTCPEKFIKDDYHYSPSTLNEVVMCIIKCLSIWFQNSIDTYYFVPSHIFLWFCQKMHNYTSLGIQYYPKKSI